MLNKSWKTKGSNWWKLSPLRISRAWITNKLQKARRIHGQQHARRAKLTNIRSTLQLPCHASHCQTTHKQSRTTSSKLWKRTWTNISSWRRWIRLTRTSWVWATRSYWWTRPFWRKWACCEEKSYKKRIRQVDWSLRKLIGKLNNRHMCLIITAFGSNGLSNQIKCYTVIIEILNREKESRR